MMKTRFMTLALILLLVPMETLAGPISNVVNAVSGGNLPTFGNASYMGIVQLIRTQVLLFIDVIAVLLLVRAGLRLINSQDEDKLNKAKTTIAATLVGIMFAHLSERLFAAFLFPGGTANPGAIEMGAAILSLEVAGIINWVLTLVAALGILMIVVSGIRTIASFGKEDGAAQLKQTVFGTITGIAFLIVSGAVKLTLGLVPEVVPSIPGSPDTNPIIYRVAEIVVYLMTFLGIVAFVIVAYAAFLMIFNLGNEDQFKKGKDLIVRALIGLSIVLFANVIGIFVIQLVQ